jgi:hypothetical protein
MVLSRRQTSSSNVVPAKSDPIYFDLAYTGTNEANSRDESGGGSFYGQTALFIQFFALALISYYAFTTKCELQDLSNNLVEVNHEFDALNENLSNTEEELEQVRTTYTRMKEKIYSIDPADSHDQSDNLFDRIIQRHEVQASRIIELQNSIQESHRRDLEETYGPGPYQIEITILIDGEERFLVMETAPNELMPHSVYTFLQMVEAHTWDDTVLLGIDHVILATLEDTENNLKISDSIRTLSFPEYSEDYPHVENTVGFVGRPGGPRFYINSFDNSEDHGPGGQKRYALVEEADPCFGKIIHGLDLLPRLKEHNGSIIKGMVILDKEK